MEENSENASPFSGPAAGSGEHGDAGPGTAAAAGPASTAGGISTSSSPNLSLGSNGSIGAATGARYAPSQNGQSQPNGSMPSNSTNGAGSAANANGHANNGTIGGKTFVAKRSRLVGLPPPVHSPLGASSPSLTSNAPTFPNQGPASSSGSSSTATTPSASPQQHHSQLPPVSPAPSSNYGGQQSPFGPGLGSGQANGAGSVSATTNPHLYPALHLHPLNDTFIPKQISLYPPGPHNRIKIGRQTNAKTVPAPNNGYFDSKVLSRMHAEVWCEGNKVYIKDVKSSNGTFINGERLSPEAVESDIFELHSNDMVEFGIDITSEDTKTIVHHKVAARCFLVMNAEDAIATSRTFSGYYRDMGESPFQKRAGFSAGKAAPNVNLDQVLNRLQTELAKSRETGAELNSLTGTIAEIHDTLGGNVPGPPMPSFRVPPFVPPNPNAPMSPQQIAQQSHQQTQQMLSNLQGQLQDTQNALNGHVERVRNLEGLLSEQDRMRGELKEVKDRMEEARVEWGRLKESQERASEAAQEDDGDSDKGEDLEEHETDDNMRTIRLDGGLEDLATEVTHTSPKSRSEPDEDYDVNRQSFEDLETVQMRLADENAELSQRMDALSKELSAASQLSNSLKGQYAQAAETIRGLEEKISKLEKALHKDEVEAPAIPITREAPAVTHVEGKEDILREIETRFSGWKKSFEEAVTKEREGWEEEREKLRVTVQEWERRSSLSQQQAESASSSNRKKRRSKASTVGTSSEDSSGSENDSIEGGFASPVTDDSTMHPGSQSRDIEGKETRDSPKRPRSRRRRRAPNSLSASRLSTSPDKASRASQSPDLAESGDALGRGSAVQRRRSWIPFSQASNESPVRSSAKDASPSPASGNKGHQDASRLMKHPAIPYVSAASLVVIGYLAYTAVLQHQK